MPHLPSPAQSASLVIDAIHCIVAALGVINRYSPGLTLEQKELVDGAALADIDEAGLKRLSLKLADTTPDTFEPVGRAADRVVAGLTPTDHAADQVQAYLDNKRWREKVVLAVVEKAVAEAVADAVSSREAAE